MISRSLEHPENPADRITVLYLSVDPFRPDEAWAFAQFLKRARWDHYRALAVSADEATAMQGLAEQLRQAFAEQGYAPR